MRVGASFTTRIIIGIIILEILHNQQIVQNAEATSARGRAHGLFAGCLLVSEQTSRTDWTDSTPCF